VSPSRPTFVSPRKGRAAPNKGNSPPESGVVTIPNPPDLDLAGAEIGTCPRVPAPGTPRGWRRRLAVRPRRVSLGPGWEVDARPFGMAIPRVDLVRANDNAVIRRRRQRAICVAHPPLQTAPHDGAHYGSQDIGIPGAELRWYRVSLALLSVGELL
jgi:hypothetical protein